MVLWFMMAAMWIFNLTDLTTTSRFFIKFRNCKICITWSAEFSNYSSKAYGILFSFPTTAINSHENPAEVKKVHSTMLSLNNFLCIRGNSYLYDALKTLGFIICLILFNSICTACSYSTGKTSRWFQRSNGLYVS